MSEQASGFIVVFCTAPDGDAALRVARRLVESRLAACVNVVPGLISVYRWKKAVHEDGEVLLVIKSRASLFDGLAAVIAAEHPYSVPEVLALPVAAGADSYLSWLASETVGEST